MPVIPLRDSAIPSTDEDWIQEKDDPQAQFRRIRSRLAHVCSGYVRAGNTEASKYPTVTLDGNHLTTYWFGPSAILLSCRKVTELPHYGDLVVIEAILTMPGYEGQGFAKRALRGLLNACRGVHAPVICRPDARISERLELDVDDNADSDGHGVDQNRLLKTLKELGFVDVDNTKCQWLLLKEKG